jgi:hypothetical protein
MVLVGNNSIGKIQKITNSEQIKLITNAKNNLFVFRNKKKFQN